MICIACGREYNYLLEVGVTATFCSVACRTLTGSAPFCFHGRTETLCVRCNGSSKMTSDEKLEVIEELLHHLRCSDGNCIYGHPGGMGTNGGCRSMDRYESVKDLRQIVQALRYLLKDRPLVPTKKAEEKNLPNKDRFAKLDIP